MDGPHGIRSCPAHVSPSQTGRTPRAGCGARDRILPRPCVTSRLDRTPAPAGTSSRTGALPSGAGGDAHLPEPRAPRDPMARAVEAATPRPLGGARNVQRRNVSCRRPQRKGRNGRVVPRFGFLPQRDITVPKSNWDTTNERAAFPYPAVQVVWGHEDDHRRLDPRRPDPRRPRGPVIAVDTNLLVHAHRRESPVGGTAHALMVGRTEPAGAGG